MNNFSQKTQQDIYPFQKQFSKAYIQYTDVPKGILEAVAFTTTRINHITNATKSCVGVPKVYGVMGLTLNGQGYFKNNLKYVSKISRISIDEIIANPEKNILAFAAAFHNELSLLEN